MSVNAKHIATFLLGAAAGFALAKYMSMTDEEKEKFMNDLKSRAQGMKEKAEEGFDKMKDYFDELREKGSAAFKAQFHNAEEMFQDIFGKAGK